MLLVVTTFAKFNGPLFVFLDLFTTCARPQRTEMHPVMAKRKRPTPFPFRRLPNELQIEVLKQYFTKYNINYDIATYQPDDATEHMIGLYANAAGIEDDLCVLWTSPDIYLQAVKALHECFQGKLTVANFIYQNAFRVIKEGFTTRRLNILPPLHLIKTLSIREDDVRDSAASAITTLKALFAQSWDGSSATSDTGDLLTNLERIEVTCRDQSFFNLFNLHNPTDYKDFTDGNKDNQLMTWIKGGLPQQVGHQAPAVRRGDGFVVPVSIRIAAQEYNRTLTATIPAPGTDTGVTNFEFWSISTKAVCEFYFKTLEELAITNRMVIVMKEQVLTNEDGTTRCREPLVTTYRSA